MALSYETVQKALYLKEQAVKKQEYIYEKSLEKAKEDFPRINEIDLQLTQIGTSLLKYAMNADTSALEKCKNESLLLSKEKEELLKTAGVKEKTVFCKVCNDTGYVSGKLCECIKSVAKELAVKELNDSMPINNVGFDSFSLHYYPDDAQPKMERILNFCKKYAKNFSSESENLLFMGKCGLGKTHLSLSIVKELTKKGVNVVYGPAQTLFNAAEKEHFSYSGNREKTDEILNAELLVIDDLGTEFITNYVQSLFYDIVNSRILRGLPTIINTNLSFEELEARYTPRITSRLIGEYCVKSFVGSDIRVLKKIESK